MDWHIRRLRILVIALAVGSVLAVAPWQARAQLYTTYNLSPNGFSWITCGSTSALEGCFGSGAELNFGRLCAIVSDGNAGTTFDSTQKIYALDSNATGKNDVVLHYLTRRISVDATGYAYTTFKDVKDVGLPLVGGNKVSCYAADNAAVIVAGTNTSTGAAVVRKNSLAVSNSGGFSPPATLIGITADASGNIAINFNGGFELIGPTGSGLADGGGNGYVLPLHNALTP